MVCAALVEGGLVLKWSAIFFVVLLLVLMLLAPLIHHAVNGRGGG